MLCFVLDAQRAPPLALKRCVQSASNHNTTDLEKITNAT
jgi:hypothetical protein